jgi:hypothetical protein
LTNATCTTSRHKGILEEAGIAFCPLFHAGNNKRAVMYLQPQTDDLSVAERPRAHPPPFSLMISRWCLMYKGKPASFDRLPILPFICHAHAVILLYGTGGPADHQQWPAVHFPPGERLGGWRLRGLWCGNEEGRFGLCTTLARLDP